MSKPWKMSVVVCTRNRPQDVATCLPTVLACPFPDVEVVLVDQSTGTQTCEIARRLQRDWPHLVYVPTDTVGKSIALGLGIARAQGDILAFTDDDCEVPECWLVRIASAFERSPHMDILFGPVLPSPAIENLDDVCVPAWSFSEPRELAKGEVCGMGANMALRRSALQRLDGAWFDPLLGPGAPFPAGEEGDFVYRLRAAGARAALRPALAVWHRAFRLPDHWQTVLHGYGVGDGAFHAKHARCGDSWAWRTIAHHLAYYGARAAGKRLLRRTPNSDMSTLRGYWRGLTKSLHYALDKKTRLYTLAQTPPAADTIPIEAETQAAAPSPERSMSKVV